MNLKRSFLAAMLPVVVLSIGCQKTQDQPAAETDIRAEAVRLAQRGRPYVRARGFWGRGAPPPYL